MREVKALEVLNYASDFSPCISMYLSVSKSQTKQQTYLELQKFINYAQSKLSQDYGFGVARELLRDIQHFIRNLEFKNKESFALFIAKGFKGVLYLPYKADNLCVVADSFHTKPLIKWLQDPNHFYLVSLSAKKIKLFQGSSKGMHELRSYNLEILDKRDMVYRRGGKGERNVADGKQRKRQEALFLKEIKRICPMLEADLNMEEAPLLLAGSSQLKKIYYENSTYPYVLEESLNGSFASAKNHKFFQAANQLVQNYHKRRQEELINKYKEKNGEKSIVKIAEAASSGRIEKLLVAEDYQLWGIYDKDSGKIVIHDRQLNAKDEDILDDISEQVLKCRGNVFVLPKNKMPDDSLAYAIYRW